VPANYYQCAHPGRFILDVNLDAFDQYEAVVSWLTAPEALQVLGVRPQTLYANVSRKKIRAKPDPKDTRRSLYHEVDVRKLARQHGGRRKATVVAAGTIEWGDPVLSSALSTVVDGRLYYRGKDVVGLAEDQTLEEVAALLWGAPGAVEFELAWSQSGRATGEAGDLTTAGRAGAARGADDQRAAPSHSASTPLQRAFLALGVRAGTDVSSYGRALPVLQAEAAGVLVTLAGAMLDAPIVARVLGRDADRRLGAAATRVGVGRRRSSVGGRRGGAGEESSGGALHERVASSFGRPSAADLLRRTLVLMADHELNASTFAARVAVSTGAPLSAGVLSGLATLSGPLHGRAALGVSEIMAAVERIGAEKAVHDWLSQGRPIVGFGHPLYPAGDPRATALLQHLDLPRAYAELSEVVEEVIGERPNIDFALAALTKVERLPSDAPLVLFALGRCAGWLAHALEQVTTGNPIRPRARYVGPPIS
jgi:citrate synthase